MKEESDIQELHQQIDSCNQLIVHYNNQIDEILMLKQREEIRREELIKALNLQL